jgi:uncharacterized protein YbaR (Trm112 family)
LAYWYKGRYRLRRFMRVFATSPKELVLDIGSGDSPFGPADVICEKFPWDDAERTQGFFQDRPLVVGDAEDLPFCDKAFDFIYCSHVLEHTRHPDRAIQELMRVGRRGYIEMPFSYHEKAIKSVSGHFWLVDLRNGQLVFRPKSKGILDSEINDTFNRLMDRDPLFSAFYYARFYGLLHTALFWEGQIKFVMEKGSEDGNSQSFREFEKASLEVVVGQHKQPPQYSLGRLIKKGIRFFSSKKHFNVETLLACPVCKGPLDKRKSEADYFCRHCESSYPIRSGVPILLKDAARQTHVLI